MGNSVSGPGMVSSSPRSIGWSGSRLLMAMRIKRSTPNLSAMPKSVSPSTTVYTKGPEAVGVGVMVGVVVAVGVMVGVGVFVAVAVGVAVSVGVGVWVGNRAIEGAPEPNNQKMIIAIPMISRTAAMAIISGARLAFSCRLRYASIVSCAVSLSLMLHLFLSQSGIKD